jgi:hypothetical protein
LAGVFGAHADGWALGRNFFFMDTYISNGGQQSQTGFYGEAYSKYGIPGLNESLPQALVVWKF